ncbi:hypothetical protein Sjap_004629 [Stephania japonica]|uniref:Uncharacterized protein n=1 Tax=Stephania japonica TaxID=461633 RepID=A0AAP0K2U1_9MAGN
MPSRIWSISQAADSERLLNEKDVQASTVLHPGTSKTARKILFEVMMTGNAGDFCVLLKEDSHVLHFVALTFKENLLRLFEAARLGSVEALLEMLAGDPLILERVPLAQDTPLHVAVLAGKAEFAKEILRQRPRYALELNKDGFSPIHIASINGDIELVRELLKVDSSLCSLKDRDGRTPIHLASMKGRLDVMGELLSACLESAREVTVQGETILHLVVKSNQFEAFKVLVERAPFHDILNAKDQDGNTILHLAVCRKQIQVAL